MTKHTDDEYDESFYIEHLEAATDAELLEAIRRFEALPDEDDTCWDWDDRTQSAAPAIWKRAAEYRAFLELAAERGLSEAIPLLLQRAPFGDPGEYFRDALQDCLVFAAGTDRNCLFNACSAELNSPRNGTRQWALETIYRAANSANVAGDVKRTTMDAVRMASDKEEQRLQRIAQRCFDRLTAIWMDFENR